MEGKLLVRKARRRKLVLEAGSKDVERRMTCWREINGFLAEQIGAYGTFVWLLSFFVAISDQRDLWLLDLRKLSGNLG